MGQSEIKCHVVQIRSSIKKIRLPKQFAKAYATWHYGNASKWMKKMQASTHALNVEQQSFMQRIIDRCETEAREMNKDAKQTSEPLRDCLLGFPGTGKSTCINAVRKFFSEVLGWEAGVQFQFLASQNTMAALIEGQTIHSCCLLYTSPSPRD